MLKIEVETPAGGHTKQSDALCTQCHTKPGRAGGAGGAGGAGEAGEAGRAGQVASERGRGPASIEKSWPDHTHHAADSQGSRCVECHMADVNWRLITRRRDHTFQPPVPELTVRFGEPNACTTCHENKSPEWAISVMDDWYGNADRRRKVVAVADTIYRAGAGDTSVVADVARLAVDRSLGAPVRASAAEFVGQLLSRKPTAEAAEINALIGAAADPEAIVRITAVRALATVEDPRALPVLAAHLNDPARLVRVSAAEGLLRRGVSKLDGAGGQVLSRAQDELAESLRTFNDLAGDHTTLGRLYSARGDDTRASSELETAIQLDPRAAEPHVYLGVMAARAGRYGDAVQHWKTARALDHDYPNLDRLIEEAQKRLTARH
jgi:HEAT repeats